MTCPFCDIVDGDGDGDTLVLEETDETIAFVPLDPVSEGHLLVVPKTHYESLFDIPAETLAEVTTHARSIVRRLRDADFDGANLLHASGEAAQQSVSHFHLHVAPRRADDGLDLWPASGYDEGEGKFDRPYERIRDALELECADRADS
ncbi:histidine triad (HIT) family protein [Halobiforma haloterrestris]|uniref:Histidine triad (HIT) family protein n=1 Tax=Natronobacterium haloterrestre TaxID=148448 RepID=A0A1I1LFS5_NATHA|nr:HIT domain-containing protein [Halobiforma haloterrestris]SFC71372.1 histidine triad (HIT) family protein [Halobiforma haloterrestris]